ncbi:MAG: glycosyltransferase [Anaerolineae bacterium]
MDTKSLSVIIAALNEAANLELLIPMLRQQLIFMYDDYEIIVVNGESSDNTADVVKRLGVHVEQQHKAGYGGALQQGFAVARGSAIMTMDADLSHPPVFIKSMLNALQNAEMVIASRYVRGGTADMPGFRRLLSRTLNVFFARGLSLPVKDASSGFRLYRADVLRNLELRQTDFSILEEILVKIIVQGYHVVEIPFHYAARGKGHSKAKIFKFGLSYLKVFAHLWRTRNSIDAGDYDARAYDSPILPQRLWQRARHQTIVRWATGANRILDVGSGSGMSAWAIPNVIALDINRAKLRFLNGWHHVPVVEGSAFALPFSDASFDCVICSEMIEHLPADERIFQELVRVLAPGGQLILGTPDYASWLWRFTERMYQILMPWGYAEEHITHYTRTKLMSIANKYGLAVDHQKYVFGSELILCLRKTISSK